MSRETLRAASIIPRSDECVQAADLEAPRGEVDREKVRSPRQLGGNRPGRASANPQPDQRQHATAVNPKVRHRQHAHGARRLHRADPRRDEVAADPQRLAYRSALGAAVATELGDYPSIERVHHGLARAAGGDHRSMRSTWS